MTAVLIAGGTGMLGSRIADHLIEQKEVDVRLLMRESVDRDPAKTATIDALIDRGARIVTADLTQSGSLDAATRGVDAVVSALQGRREVIVDGQTALAQSAARNGVRRFIPSDFAIDLFSAPAGAPQFDLRKEAALTIDALDIEMTHVLNGGFMDMMLDPRSAGIIDVENASARIWGTGDEPFNLTTLDDTARFTARIATDPADLHGVRMVSGAETTFNAIIAKTEELTGRSFTRNSIGDADTLRKIVASASDDPWSVTMQWYALSMITVPAFAVTENDRYPDLELTGLDQYLTKAHKSFRRLLSTASRDAR